MPPHAKPSVFRHSSPQKKIFGTRVVEEAERDVFVRKHAAGVPNFSSEKF